MALIPDAPNDYKVLDKNGNMSRVWYSWLQELVDVINNTAEIEVVTQVSPEAKETIKYIIGD